LIAVVVMLDYPITKFLMNKVVANADEAIRDVFEGATIMIGGFGLCGMQISLSRRLT